jgi:hypothetical protein
MVRKQHFFLIYFISVLLSGFELVLFADLLRLGQSFLNLSAIVSTHAAFSAIFAVCVSRIAVSINCSKGGRKSRKVFFLSILAVTFYIPLIGYFCIAFYMSPFQSRSGDADDDLPLINRNGVPDLTGKSIDAVRSSATEIESMLQYSDRNDIRLEALIGTLTLADKDAIPLLRIALKDSVDDIRLLAYALLDVKERRINDKIDLLKESLEEREHPRVASLCSIIAREYFELAEIGLARGDAREFALRLSIEYIEKALREVPDNAEMQVQYARANLKLGELDNAEQGFRKAEQLGIDRERLLIFYSEIAFLRKEFDRTKSLMSELFSGTRSHRRVAGVVGYWAG